MEKVELYKNIIRKELSEWEELNNSDMPSVRNIFLEDVERNSFVLITMGWHNNTYIHNWLIHIEIKEEKIWIHEDLTGIGIINQLLEKEIPKSDIILAFIEPYLRDNTGLAKAS